MNNSNKIVYKAIAIGVSAGGMRALIELFKNLQPDFPIPIIVTQHMYPLEESSLAEVLDR